MADDPDDRDRRLRAATELARALIADRHGLRLPVSSGDEEMRALERVLNELSEHQEYRSSLEATTRRIFAANAERLDRLAGELLRTNEILSQEVIERTRAEETLRARDEQLVQASKMAAVGQLAAGVAHEINNPLSVILGFARGIERRLAEVGGDALRLPVTSIVREALRCRDLVQDLLTFSRTGRKASESIDLEGLVRTVGSLLESRAGSQDTNLRIEVCGELPRIEGNRTQLEQVVINLGNNALDALGTGGQVFLRLSRDNARHVIVEVEDTGPGIPEGVRNRIFEPFFTTKEVGKGTGLGLSLAYEIVHQHGGTLDVRSASGNGTTMTVRLPAFEAAGAEGGVP